MIGMEKREKIKYQEPVWTHLFRLYNEVDMEVQEYLGDENQGKQK